MDAQFFSVLADEVSSHNVEHLVLCIRFVDSNLDIREEFIPFLKLERVRAMDITDAIVGTVYLGRTWIVLTRLTRTMV